MNVGCRTAIRTAAVGLVGLTLIGCSTTSKEVIMDQPHLTVTQATAQIKAYAQESLRALPPGASLREIDGLSSVPCDEFDQRPDALVDVAIEEWIDGLDAAGNSSYLDAFVRYWTGQGWQVSADRRPGDPWVALRNQQGYALTISTTPEGTGLSLSSSSPCVSPDHSSSADASAG